MRKSRIELLISKFENLQMEENETIRQYHARISYISKESFVLGEKILEEKLIWKVLRPLLERFAYKATAIGEAKNRETMKLEELIGSLRTFEMKLDEDKKQRKRTVAFQVEPQQVEEEEGDDLAESMSLLTKNFNQVARKINKRLKGSYQTKSTNFASNPFIASFKGNRFFGVNTEPANKSKGIQCRECEGYGHIQTQMCQH